MSESKHTPGPWTICGMSSTAGGPVTHLVVNGSDGPALGEFGVFICAVSPVESLNERDEANARLIAAAPDLYEVVREYVAWCDANNVTAPPSQRARAALAKARQ